METLLVLNKNTFTILAERKLLDYKFQAPQFTNDNPYNEIIKDLVQLNNLLKPSDDYAILELDKVIIYRQNPSNNLSVILICERKSCKKLSLIILSKILLDNISYDELI